MKMRYVFFPFAIIFLVYLIIPGPTSVNDFPSLPNSVKSDLSGDTWQVPNVVGYFSDNYRKMATSYYKNIFQQKNILFLPPIRLNYPPEFAYTAIKVETQSTYLEEYLYPLRNSVFVNGLEPFSEDGQRRFWGSTKFEIGDQAFFTKVTLRFYPSPIWARLVVWVGICLSLVLLWKLGRRILSGE